MFVDQMKSQGLQIDIYGHCGTKLRDPKEMISLQYKFCCSFENSLCSDIVTEKVFAYLPLNTVLIVRGGANYKRLLPDNLFINTANFNSFADLAEYLKLIGSNETLYTGYLKRRYEYGSEPRKTRYGYQFVRYAGN